MKRLTETDKWQDSWFCDLSSVHKLVWLWACDKCDCAGVVDFSQRAIEFAVGEKFDPAEFLIVAQGRVVELRPGKWFVKPFIKFQYGLELNPESGVHRSVIKRLNDNGVTSPVPMLGEKKKVNPPVLRFVKPTLEELKLAMAKAGCPETEAQAFLNYYDSNGWKVGRNPMRSWAGAVGNWAKNYRMGANRGSGRPAAIPLSERPTGGWL
jgi:hypothetical protein